MLYAFLILTFHVDYADGIDTFYHADGVFPVVGTVGILGVIFYAHSLRLAHVALHDCLLDASHLLHGVEQSVAHLLYAVAGQIALGTAWIADSHGEVALTIAVDADRQVGWLDALSHRGGVGAHRHVVLGIVGRTACLRVNIDAKDRYVARLARPHPVVSLATKLTQ